jgi:hypothetical protein
MDVRNADADHGSAVGGLLTGQNVHRNSVIVLPEREREQTRQNLWNTGGQAVVSTARYRFVINDG